MIVQMEMTVVVVQRVVAIVVQRVERTADQRMVLLVGQTTNQTVQIERIEKSLRMVVVAAVVAAVQSPLHFGSQKNQIETLDCY